MSFDPEKPYNNLPLLPPKAEIETKAVLKKLVAASQFLAELKGYVELLPNKAIIINSIILQEAKDSSEIENIVTTHDQLFRAMAANKKIVEERYLDRGRAGGIYRTVLPRVFQYPCCGEYRLVGSDRLQRMAARRRPTTRRSQPQTCL